MGSRIPKYVMRLKPHASPSPMYTCSLGLDSIRTCTGPREALPSALPVGGPEKRALPRVSARAKPGLNSASGGPNTSAGQCLNERASPAVNAGAGQVSRDPTRPLELCTSGREVRPGGPRTSMVGRGPLLPREVVSGCLQAPIPGPGTAPLPKGTAPHATARPLAVSRGHGGHQQLKPVARRGERAPRGAALQTLPCRPAHGLPGRARSSARCAAPTAGCRSALSFLPVGLAEGGP